MFTILVFVAVVALATSVFRFIKSKNKRLPPGPKGVPLLGNIFDLPPEGSPDWEYWATFKDRYGPISSVTILGTTIVLLQDFASAFEILERKCGSSAERPHLGFAMDMAGWGRNLAIQQYDDLTHRTARKQIHSYMGSQAALSRFSDIQELETHRFLLRVLRNPETLVQHIRKEAGATILEMAYGYTADPEGEDPLIEVIEQAITQLGVALKPGAFPVDNFPWLKYLPDWMPGAGFKKIGAEYKAKVEESAARPFRFVESKMANGSAEPSFLSTLHEKAGGRLQGKDASDAMWTAQAMYAGGADTTVSTIATFFLAMMMYPEVQRKAQEELDRVIGDRLPTLEDRTRLSYIESIVKECLRFHPVAPMGVPHHLTADYEYEGYFLPKGTMVIPNLWAMAHDPSVYSNPYSFNPDRFMGEQPEMEPRSFVFGWGRRVCPGRLLALSSISLTIAKSLAVFDISKPIDANGQPIEPNVQFVSGIVSHPTPFDAMIKARSTRHAEMILEVEKTHPYRGSSAKELEAITAW